MVFKNDLNAKQKEIHYTYDYAGRLIRTATDATGSGVFAYAYTVYDGENPYLQVSDSGGLADTLTTPGISQRAPLRPRVRTRSRHGQLRRHGALRPCGLRGQHLRRAG